jgi:hypothetical protein
MIQFDLRKIVKNQFDALGQVFFDSYRVGNKNPLFKALMLAVAAETLDRSAKLPSDTEPIDLNEQSANAEQLDQARRFFSHALEDPELAPARYRASREFFTAVLGEVNAEIVRRESEVKHV